MVNSSDSKKINLYFSYVKNQINKRKVFTFKEGVSLKTGVLAVIKYGYIYLIDNNLVSITKRAFTKSIEHLSSKYDISLSKEHVTESMRSKLIDENYIRNMDFDAGDCSQFKFIYKYGVSGLSFV